MSKSKRLSPLVRLAKHHEDQAARTLQQTQSELEAQRTRREDLRRFRDEYMTGFSLNAQGGLRGDQLQDYRRFLARLGEALDQQDKAIDQAQTAVRHARQHWQTKHVRVASLNKLVARAQTQERAVLEYREQLELDERATQAAVRPRPY